MTQNALGIAGMHHVALRVADLDRSLKLYRDTLGFRLKTAFALHDRRFALLDAGNRGYIELVDTARDQAFSIRVAFFRGPDGEEIELFEDQQGHT